ncbi:MAG TPA: hypothetical protein VHL57_06620 [Flavobacteriales bacterium]|jgi:hypothetical protein|nr:hypothetical protein [Flavobacteriales bacterium]
MKKMILVIAASFAGTAAFCQMGPYRPLPPAPSENTGYAYASNIQNGTCTVRCFWDPNAKCVRVIMGIDGHPVAEVFGQDGKSMGKYSFTEGQIATAPDKSSEVKLIGAKKL